MSTRPAPAPRTTAAMAGSPRAVTSLTMTAPAVRACSATVALEVSMERAAPPPAARASTTGMSRRSCSAAGTGCEPGRVLSAPRSKMSAPSRASRRACSMAAVGSRNRPPSENESGVTFTTPITSVRSARSKKRSRQRQPMGAVGGPAGWLDAPRGALIGRAAAGPGKSARSRANYPSASLSLRIWAAWLCACAA